jgi:hypothetical protein
MVKTSLCAAGFVAVLAGAAHAGGQSGSIGVGAEYQLNGIGGASLNADQGDFHAGGFVGFSDEPGAGNTTLMLGARFFWHVHTTAMSDFAVGGGFGFASVPDDAPMSNDQLSQIFIEPSVQVRLFLASNVAASATTGVVIGVVDAEGVGITGQAIGGLTTGLGLHYYFF